MGWACGMHGEEIHTGYRWRNTKDNLKWMFKETGSVGVDWINMAQDSDRWQSRVKW
jgi:hypothetical protein